MVDVVTLRPDEWRRARALRLRALADAPDAFWSTLADEQAMDDDAWRARLERPGADTLVATVPAEGGRVDGDADGDEADDVGDDVGLAVVVHRPPGDSSVDEALAGSGGLVSVWVDPRVRGQGVGEALVRTAAEHAARLGLRRLVLDVGDHNVAATRLYDRLGFRRTGRTGAFPPPREHITEHERVLELPTPGSEPGV